MKDFYILRQETDEPDSDMLITVEHNDPEAVKILFDDIIGESIGAAEIYYMDSEEQARKEFVGVNLIKKIDKDEDVGKAEAIDLISKIEKYLEL